MAPTSTLNDLDYLFDSIEAELVRRWVYHDVPNETACQPVAILRATVTIWWQLYQESTCADLGINRTVWDRPLVNLLPSLDTLTLLINLKQIHQSIHLSVLQSFRPLSLPEQKALLTLDCLQTFFDIPTADKFRQWLHLL